MKPKESKDLGEVGAKALIKTTPTNGWEISGKFYFSLDDARQDFAGMIVRWPVKVTPDGLVYVLKASELQ